MIAGSEVERLPLLPAEVVEQGLATAALPRDDAISENSVSGIDIMEGKEERKERKDC